MPGRRTLWWGPEEGPQREVSYPTAWVLPVSIPSNTSCAAGSIVSYCLGITSIDPIKYQLLFERFLNPERVSMPDIDVDFCFERRQEVIDYVVRKYGEDRVVQIVTFGTLCRSSPLVRWRQKV